MQQFTSFQINGDPLTNTTLTVGIMETVIIADDDLFIEPSTTDTGTQFTIGGVNFTSSAFPGDVGTGVEIYSATVNGLPVTFGFLTAAADGVDDAVDRLVVLSGTMAPGDTINGITLINGGNTNITYTNIPSIVCFTPGTIISTPTGSVRIEKMRVGDLVITADNGLQAVRWIGKKYVSGARMQAHPHLRPVRIKAHAFGQNRPERDLVISPQHRMHLKSKQAQLMFGEYEVLVPAKGLINDKSIVSDYASPKIEYIHIMFDKHQLVQANGVWSESFHPGSVGLDAIEEQARRELFEIFPQLQRSFSLYGKAARHSLSTSETISLLS